MYENTLIATERLMIRPILKEDIDTMYAYTSDAEHVKYMTHMPNESLEECMAFLIPSAQEWFKHAPRFYQFAVTLNGKHIGEVSVYALNKEFTEGELGWILHRDYCGKGYTTEAVKALISFCKTTLQLVKVSACCDNRNIASMKVMKNVGMSLSEENVPRKYMKREEIALGVRFEMYLEH